MAQLPNYEKAIIDPVKIKNYILSHTHPIGRFKAVVFENLGYTFENWNQLIDDIRKYHLQCSAKRSEKTVYGQKYSIIAMIKGPNGNQIIFKSIWIILKGENVPRFITIYPEGE
jgi:hypothetical protein